MRTLLESLSCCAGTNGLRRAVSGEWKAEEPTCAAEVVAQPLEPRLEAVVEAARELLPGAVLTEWQRSWCTAETVEVYLRGRAGNTRAAGQILAQALDWRQEYKEVLAGARLPKWQSDFRIIARGEDGHPLIYLCYRHHVPPDDPRAIVEHGGLVLETAIRSMRKGARQFDVVIDFHGLGGLTSPHLNPRGVFPVLNMIQQPFRERLRTAILVGTPPVFGILYKICTGFVSEETRRKALFLAPDEAADHVLQTSGAAAARKLREVMATNREGLDCRPGEVDGRRLPSEVDVGGDAQWVPRIRKDVRARTSLAVERRPRPSGPGGADALEGTSGQRRSAGRWRCCHRRHPGGSPGGGEEKPLLVSLSLLARRRLWHIIG